MFSNYSYPSTPGVSRNVLGYVNDPMMSTYNEGQPNNWYNMNYPPQYMDSSYNYMMVNNMNQAYNCAVSTSPITTPRKLLCKFNVKEYSPEDLNVKIVNSSIVIKGSHEEKRDEYGLVSRKFTRRLPIPRGILENEIEVNFIPNGILAITAKFLRLPKVRQLPIHRAYEPNNELQRYHEQQYWMNAEEHMPAINLQEPPPVRQTQVENLPSTMLIKMNEQNLYEVQNQEEGTYIN